MSCGSRPLFRSAQKSGVKKSIRAIFEQSEKEPVNHNVLIITSHQV
jgi:hypothetical protein